MSRHARPYQTKLKQDIYAAWAAGALCVLATSPTGSGKCLAPGTPVLMWDGQVKPVETIREGEFLMGPDSSPRLVLSTVAGRETMYRVTPKKGDPYVVNESHILSLMLTNFEGRVEAGDGRFYRAGDTVNISVLDYLRSSKTFRHVAKGWRTGVEFGHQSEPALIPPYILGAWLGDGTEKHRVELTSVDAPVIDAWREWAAALGCEIRVTTQQHTTCNMYSIVGTERSGRRGGSNEALNRLRQIGVFGEKHIPLSYRTAGRKDRLQLLAGVIDTDGYVHHGGCDMVFKSERLARDIAYLARSLGLACYVKPCKKTCTNNGKQGDYFRLSVSGDLSVVPCRVERRKAVPRGEKKNVLVTGIDVQAIGEGDYYGFEISGDRLFMLGDFTVTHNTFTFSEVIAEEASASAAIAHRSELVGQMALALARNGVRHRVIGPSALARQIAAIQIAELGRSYYDPNARCGVVSSKSLLNLSPSDPWLRQVRLAVGDEGHHFLRENEWGRGVAMFPNLAKMLLVTATGFRADGKGLGRGVMLPDGKWTNDGLADAMVHAPNMRWMIDNGYLTNYRIFAPPNDLDFSDVTITAGGDLSPEKNRAAMKRSSRIVGDVVKHYLDIAPGKLGVTFAVDVEEANKIAAAFNAAGVPAAVVSAKTPEGLRMDILRRFKRRELLQLVNVDLFGEGFDLPAIEVVSMVRKTESKGLFDQQFGRALRLMVSDFLIENWDTFSVADRLAFIAASGKPAAIIIDHVGNCERHGVPDGVRIHTLERRERRSRDTPTDVIPMRTCLNETCMNVYERSEPCCPFCGVKAEPQSRSAPEFVDGNLCELDEAELKRLRGEIDKVDGPVRLPPGVEGPVRQAITNRHFERQHAQKQLRETIDLWCGWQTQQGRGLEECYKRFYFMFNTDVATAMALGKPDAEALAERIQSKLTLDGVIAAV